jgi:hypothetical protein
MGNAKLRQLRLDLLKQNLIFISSNRVIIFNMVAKRCHNPHHKDIQHIDTQQNDIHHNDTQHNDIQHNDTQHNDIQHNDIQYNDIQHNDIQFYNK